jgi:hypothetical protein
MPRPLSANEFTLTRQLRSLATLQAETGAGLTREAAFDSTAVLAARLGQDQDLTPSPAAAGLAKSGQPPSVLWRGRLAYFWEVP